MFKLMERGMDGRTDTIYRKVLLKMFSNNIVYFYTTTQLDIQTM